MYKAKSNKELASTSCKKKIYTNFLNMNKTTNFKIVINNLLFSKKIKIIKTFY